MPQYNRAELGRMATESGFVRDTFEKVLRLKEILKFLNEDKFLREHLLSYRKHQDLAIAWMHFTTIIRTPVVIGI